MTTPPKISPRQAQAAAVGTIVIVVLGLYLPVVISGKTLLDNPALIDLSFSYLPFIHWMTESWHSGYFPLWSPHTTCGAPLLGYTHSGGLYPVRVLLYSLLPYYQAGSAGIIFHYLAAGLLMFVAVRQMGCRALLAAAGAIIFLFSGIFFGMTYATPMLGTAVGVLALWVALRSFFSRPTFAALAACALALAWGALPGDPETFFFGGLAAALALVIERTGRPRELPRLIGLGSFPLFMGVLICLPFFLTAMENAYFSLRGPLMPYEVIIETFSSQVPKLIPTWIFPFKYYSESTPVYQGFNHGLPIFFQGAWVPLLLLGGFVLARRDRVARGLALSWWFLLILIFLNESELTKHAMAAIPVLGALKAPAKALSPINLVGLLLVFHFLAHAAGPEGSSKVHLYLALSLAAGGLGIIIVPPWCLGGAERYVLGAAAAVTGSVAGVSILRRRPFFTGSRLAAVTALFMTAEVLLMAAPSVPRTDPDLYSTPEVIKQMNLDLGNGTRYAIFEQLMPVTKSDPPPLFGFFEVATGGNNITGPSRAQPAWIFLYQTLFFSRFIVEGPGGEHYLFNQSMTDPGTLRRDRMHLFNLTGVKVIVARETTLPFSSPYSLLKPGAVSGSLGGTIESGEQGRPLLIGEAFLKSRLNSLAGDVLDGRVRARDPGALIISAEGTGGRRLLNMQFIDGGHSANFSTPLGALEQGGGLKLAWLPRDREHGVLELQQLEIRNPDRPFQRLFKSEGVELFENHDALPRAFVVHQATVIEGLAETMDFIADPEGFHPRQEATLDVNLPGPEITTSKSTAGEQAAITAYGSNRVEMSAKTLGPALLVFTDTYFPGWKARINQGYGWEETPIARADLAFRAIRVPAGLTRIQWSYEPASFRIGLWAALAALGALIFAAGVRLREGIMKKRFTPTHPA